ncbi:MAG TPA: CPBP family intramembrane glutamic endopeptidase [Candidatus Saccharimonadales bacterium]|nr:CPBP family intramembrane glutamic endopeptidase [Candidatus Saccharimonadales bacterium]
MGIRSAATGAARLASGDRVGIALRLLLPIALLEAALWLPQRIGILFGIGALWYIAWQLRKATGERRSLGLDWRGLTRGWRPLGVTLALAAAILATAYFSGSLHRLWGLQHPWYAVVAYTCWAFVQEFMLQCFCARMLRALVSRVSSLLLSGVVFSVAHLPNPTLTLITFFAGVAFTAIYARKRNLFVVAVIHAVLGLTLAVSTPDAWFHGLRVGRDFLEGPSAIAAEVAPNR